MQELHDANGEWDGRLLHITHCGVTVYCEVVVSDFSQGTYGFAVVSNDAADTVLGVPDVEETPIIYVGDNVGKHYWDSKPMSGTRSLDPVPVDLIRHLHNNGYQLLEDVEGGWENWEGRPEWSDTYLDAEGWTAVSLSDVVDTRSD